MRNPSWNRSSDPVRRAHPDQIQYQEGLDTQTVAQQLMADGDTGRVSVSLGSAPPAIQQHITAVASLEERSVNPRTGVVDYLVPNARSKVFADEKVRLALAAATNRDAYVTAIGGCHRGRPRDVARPEVAARRPRVRPGRRRHPRRRREGQGPAHPGRGHRAGAVHGRLPVEPDGRQGDGRPGGRLAPGRVRPADQAHHRGLLHGDQRPELADQVDVFWSNWAPAWASASTILPPLFDSSINITKVGPGRDYGYWADKDLDARMAKVNTIADRAAREKAWADIDASLVAKGAYIGLAERRALYMAGSDVRNLSANTVAGGVVEFADIAVVQ